MSQEAIGKGPVLFFTSEGVMIQVPLNQITFDDNGAVDTSFQTDASTAKLKEWLAYLAKRGDLKPAGTKPGPPALKAIAQFDGPGGNNIEVTISPSGAANQVDVAVKKVDTYEGLTLATLEARLGTAAAPVAANTGLLRVHTLTAGAPMPAANPDVAPDAAAGAVTWTIAKNAAAPENPVKLEAKRAGAGFDADDFVVAISNVVGSSFTLTVTWAPTPVTNVELADIPADLDAAFQYLVKFAAPAQNVAIKLPAPVTTTLGGGRDALAPAAAVATVLAKP
jgi:hypothetical protein